MENFFSTQAKSETNWRVEPTAKMRKYDSTLLSHILYDPYTEKVAKRFNAQFISKPPETRIFPEVEPWFRGPATVRCKGRWVNNGNTFLCLSLIGCSVPKGPIIEWITPEFDSTDGIDGAGRFILPQSVRTAEEEELLHEESFLEPDGHAETTIVRVPPFESIGTPRTIISSRKTIKGNKSNVGPNPRRLRPSLMQREAVLAGTLESSNMWRRHHLSRMASCVISGTLLNPCNLPTQNVSARSIGTRQT